MRNLKTFNPIVGQHKTCDFLMTVSAKRSRCEKVLLLPGHIPVSPWQAVYEAKNSFLKTPFETIISNDHMKC